ncbi:MAG: hypothetical protein IKY27_00135 [Bacteroidales bacterium]|nr:hypothetical protein [Bacteroidales bacterium]
MNDSIDNMKKDYESHEKRITKHGEEIDEIKRTVHGITTKMEMYHNIK